MATNDDETLLNSRFFVLPQNQHNGTRLNYIMSERRPVSENVTVHCRLRGNGFYFFRATRTDGQLRYSETQMRSLVRTVLFLHVFSASPRESMIELLVDGAHATHVRDRRIVRADIGISDVIRLMDDTFGDGFSSVARNAVIGAYNEYATRWRYHCVGAVDVRTPHALDYAFLNKFANASQTRHSDAVQFVNDNTTDRRVLLQGNVKILSTQHRRRRRPLLLTRRRSTSESSNIDGRSSRSRWKTG